LSVYSAIDSVGFFDTDFGGFGRWLVIFGGPLG
jgi:hypothetical protein